MGPKLTQPLFALIYPLYNESKGIFLVQAIYNHILFPTEESFVLTESK
jgi:hypothetical protein